jgi:hypothetical protein
LKHEKIKRYWTKDRAGGVAEVIPKIERRLLAESVEEVGCSARIGVIPSYC